MEDEYLFMFSLKKIEICDIFVLKPLFIKKYLSHFAFKWKNIQIYDFYCVQSS